MLRIPGKELPVTKASRRVALAVLATLASWCLAPAARSSEPEVLESGLKPEDVERKPYGAYVRECLDLLIEHGTDRYGKVHAPVLVNILDVRTRTCPENPLALDEEFRVSRRERRGPAGCNLYPDQATLRTMFVLSEIAGDPRYASFARGMLAYWMKHLVDEKGLFWWGWHRHYDAYRDVMTGHLGNPHEIHVQQAIWPQLWEVDPAAVRREIEAVWQWHVIDKRTGEVNRHADGQRGCDFAMSAGEILNAFAFLYAKTREPPWLDRTRLVADYHGTKRHPATGLIPNRPNAGSGRFDGSHFDTSITGLYCHSLLAAFELTGERAFRDQAASYLKAYGKYGYDAQAEQFWGSLKLDGTPVPGPREPGGYAQYEPRGHVDLWQPYSAGYEHPIPTAQAYALAYQVTRDRELLVSAERWAEGIRRALPPRSCDRSGWYREYGDRWAPRGTYAAHYGGTISLFLHLHHLTGRPEYLGVAREVAREALSKLYYRGLLRGHPCKPYYESLDGVGYLLYSLVQLDQVLAGSGGKKASWENW
jgi:hypothetical protein